MEKYDAYKKEKEEKKKMYAMMDDGKAEMIKAQIEDARILNSKKVMDIFQESLKTSEEWAKNNDTSNVSDDFVIPGTTKVEGITCSAFLDNEVIKQHDEDIKNMLNELPEQFHLQGGGGYSFLQACYDKHNHHWGEQMHMQALFMMGVAAGMVRALFPKDLWIALPGGVPYYVIDTTKEWKEDKRDKCNIVAAGIADEEDENEAVNDTYQKEINEIVKATEKKEKDLHEELISLLKECSFRKDDSLYENLLDHLLYEAMEVVRTVIWFTNRFDKVQFKEFNEETAENIEQRMGVMLNIIEHVNNCSPDLKILLSETAMLEKNKAVELYNNKILALERAIPTAWMYTFPALEMEYDKCRLGENSSDFIRRKSLREFLKNREDFQEYGITKIEQKDLDSMIEMISNKKFYANGIPEETPNYHQLKIYLELIEKLGLTVQDCEYMKSVIEINEEKQKIQQELYSNIYGKKYAANSCAAAAMDE